MLSFHKHFTHKFAISVRIRETNMSSRALLVAKPSRSIVPPRHEKQRSNLRSGDAWHSPRRGGELNQPEIRESNGKKCFESVIFIFLDIDHTWKKKIYISKYIYINIYIYIHIYIHMHTYCNMLWVLDDILALSFSAFESFPGECNQVICSHQSLLAGFQPLKKNPKKTYNIYI